jgi:hypothetical protein
MLPLAPPLLSTITFCPSCSPSLCASRRATRSVGPPGGKGTTIVIGLAGQACANAGAPEQARAAAAITAARTRGRLRWVLLTGMGFSSGLSFVIPAAPSP